MSTRKAKVHGPTSKTVAANVRRLRQRASLTLKELSNRTNGFLPTEALQKIENGTAPTEEGRVVRHVSTDELVVLAAALRCSPTALLLPPSADGDTEVTGVGPIATRDAWRWARGQKRLPRDEDPSDPADREKALKFQRENAPDEPPEHLPENLGPDQMRALLAVMEAFDAARELGLSPRAVAHYMANTPQTT